MTAPFIAIAPIPINTWSWISQPCRIAPYPTETPADFHRMVTARMDNRIVLDIQSFTHGNTGFVGPESSREPDTHRGGEVPPHQAPSRWER